MKNVHEPTYSFVILTLVLIVVNTVIARLSVIALPGDAAGVSMLYVAVAVSYTHLTLPTICSV